MCMKLSKTFTGDLIGTAEGTMLSAGSLTPGNAAAYVAIDQVTGTLAGEAGGFMLIHRGTIDKSGASDLSVIIAPGSGTGALEGISGSLAIERRDGQHFYDLTCVLPGWAFLGCAHDDTTSHVALTQRTPWVTLNAGGETCT